MCVVRQFGSALGAALKVPDFSCCPGFLVLLHILVSFGNSLMAFYSFGGVIP